MARSTTATRPVTRRKAPVTKAVTRPVTQPEIRDAAAVTATAVAVLEAPPADDPAADVTRADNVAQLVGQRLTDAELAVAEARDELRGLALLAEIDGTMAAQRDAVRARLRDAEERLGELRHAQVAAADLSREARARALLARRDTDWQAAAEALDEAAISARALDSLLAQAGDLYGRIQRQMAEAASRVGRHLARPEYAVPPPPLADTLRLVLSNAGGPPIDGRLVLHMDPAERSSASVAGVIKSHSRQVMGYRPIGPATEEDSDHDD